MEFSTESRQGITSSDCPQDDSKTHNKTNPPIIYPPHHLPKSSRKHLRCPNSRKQYYWLKQYKSESTSLWTITVSVALISLISVVSESEAASIVVSKPSDNINNSVISSLLKDDKSKVNDPPTEDVEFSHQTEVNSPLHVAQCRSTCLQKFNNRLDGKASTSTLTSTASSSPCFTHSDCFTCWKSCEVLESLAQWTSSLSSSNSNAPSTTTNNNGIKGKGDDDKVGSTKKSKSLGTMCSHSPRLCLSGCQVACGFYEGLMMRMNEPMSGPVVATKRENVLHISSGKIEWPREPKSSKKDIKMMMKLAEFLNPQQQNHEAQSTLVYVLIQQYPDLKWRQIIQTTDTSVEIAKSLSTQMANKLRNVRVLVVSPNGLVTIYYPEQQMQQHINQELALMGDSSTKKNEHVVENTDPIIITEVPIIPEAMDVKPSSDLNVDENYPLREEKTIPDVKSQMDELESDLWELRRVSLIHQKSLVIAELTWNPIKYSEDQEYLITWELDGGGLKGHLVTDSTTVSLSLWPDTLYHIQVELFEREEEEEDGEQGDQDEKDASTSNSKPKSKSFPLTVDTSEASYPLLEKPSALSNNFEDGSNAPTTTTSTASGHKSVTEFLNVTLLLTISSAALLVLGSLLLALSWHNMVLQRRRCSSRDPQLLQDTDDSSSSITSPEENSPTKHHSSYESPSVAIISPAQLVYPSEKVHQGQQQWPTSASHQKLHTTSNTSHNNNPQNYHHDSSSTSSAVAPCWWQNLSTRRESNNHYHINNHQSSNSIDCTRMYVPCKDNRNSLPASVPAIYTQK